MIGSSEATVERGRLETRRIGLLRDGRPCAFGVEEGPAWSSANSDWSGFLLEEHAVTGRATLPKGTTCFPNPLVLLYTSGQAVLKYRIRTKTHECRLAPGVVRILYGEYELSSLSWSGAHSMLAVEISGPGAAPVAASQAPPVWAGLAPHIAADDPQIGRLVRTMRAEIEAGCPAGRLFGETLSAALAAYMLGRYAADPDRRPSRDRLSPREVARILDYIDANLATELSLPELARLVTLSPHHFSWLFKNTLDVSPYQFVIRRRIDRAKVLLAAGRASIAEIASALGFSSQSHFTAVFRKTTGTTPRLYRE